ncbi:MAG: hypothetical protein HQK61_08065 [Desulfamplus sp.]|nr:hypothetical protein [Desulfamplus sp.]
MIFLSSGVHLASKHIDDSFKFDETEYLLYLPSGKFLQGAALCYDEMLADFMFIKTIGYLGSHAETDRNYTYLDQMLNVVTTLDPFYEFPYEFGGIVLATEVGKVDSSISLLKKGMENVPQNHERYWYLPFYYAFNFMYYKNDYLTAAKYIELSTKYKNSPSYLPLLAARLRANTESPEAAIPFLQEMIKSTDNETLKNNLALRIDELKAVKQVKSDIQLLEYAVKYYYSIYNKYPEYLWELIITGIIAKVPEHPMGGSYYFSHQDKTVKSTFKTLPLYIDKTRSLEIKATPK